GPPPRAGRRLRRGWPAEVLGPPAGQVRHAPVAPRRHAAPAGAPAARQAGRGAPLRDRGREPHGLAAGARLRAVPRRRGRAAAA
ncbi:unnamed protein product, partial [Prorocentrum cordatum]